MSRPAALFGVDGSNGFQYRFHGGKSHCIIGTPGEFRNGLSKFGKNFWLSRTRYVALRQSCGRLLLTGAGSIFHLDRFHPDFSTVRPQWSPAAAFYVGLDKPGSITTTCTKSFAEFTKHAGNDRGLTSRHCERGFQNDYA